MKTVLIVEDESIVAKDYKLMLENSGFKVVGIADNSKEAVEKASLEKPEIILMDIKMPIMDGFECVEKIRLINNEIPIIAVTAYAFSADQQKAIEVGCNDYISKPYNWSLLIEKIKSFVG